MITSRRSTSSWGPTRRRSINLYAANNADVVPLPRRQLPHDGDPAPELSKVSNAQDRARIEGTNALELLPNLAARIAADG
jgi:hypothetical protein